MFRSARVVLARSSQASFRSVRLPVLQTPTLVPARTLQSCNKQFRTMSDVKYEAKWKAMVDDCVAMPCSLTFTAVEEMALDAKKTIAVVGTKASLEAFGASGKLPAGVQATYDLLLTKLKAKPANVVSLSQLFVEGDVEELVVGIVSEEASRHASPHRGDQVAQFVRKVKAKETSALVLAAPSTEAFNSYATAAARAHPLCKLTGDNAAFEVEGRESMPTGVWVDGEQPDAKMLKQMQIVAESVQLTGRLVDTPTNFLNTKTYAQIVEGLAKRFGFGCDVIEGEALQEKGMEVMYAVGRAAEHQATLCVLSHTPEVTESDEVVAWCGKGVVYDTGGLSIKPTGSMCGMKRDMGGSAGVFGAFVAAVRLGAPVKLHALLGLVDNAINSYALRNDDVVKCLSGKTIEISNTDAEGRLVLVDTVAYAHKTFNPTTVVDMATLTGAQVCCKPCYAKHNATGCRNRKALRLSVQQQRGARGPGCGSGEGDRRPVCCTFVVLRTM